MLEYMLIRPAERTLVGLATRELALAFEDGLKLLVEETGLGPTLCRARLRAVLEAGNAATLPSGEPVFAFRLHQFLASGGSVYATLEAPGARLLSTEGAGLRREGRRERAEAALSARLLPRVRAGELTPEGGITRTPLAGAIEGWLQPKPLMLCLRCRASYDLRETRLPQARHAQPDRALDRNDHRGDGGGRRPARRPRGGGRGAEAPELHRQPPGRGAPGRAHEPLCSGRAAARRARTSTCRAPGVAVRRDMLGNVRAIALLEPRGSLARGSYQPSGKSSSSLHSPSCSTVKNSASPGISSSGEFSSGERGTSRSCARAVYEGGGRPRPGF
jgi:hypothetical protein